MSEHGESHIGFDSSDHQTAYIYGASSGGREETVTERPTKRRKLRKPSKSKPVFNLGSTKFQCLLDGSESDDSALLRQDLFYKCWSQTDAQIQSILNEANEDALAEVTIFVNDTNSVEDGNKLPTSFIVSGPNIASQDLLFKQLSDRLGREVDGPIIVLRSGDTTNLKAVLKQIIRSATQVGFEEEGFSTQQDGRKLLNYDLEILRAHVKNYGAERVVIAFQDSEAFDTQLLVDLIALFHSWRDRIPFVLLFGVATSVELFQERLTKAASRCLHGIQVDVEQSSAIIERIFKAVITSSREHLMLGPALLSTLLERQQDHVQSVQSFIAAIKYIYMCHFYGNPLSVLSDSIVTISERKFELQSYQFEATRTLSSFRTLIEGNLNSQQPERARNLLQNDHALGEEVAAALRARDSYILRLLRAVHVFESIKLEKDVGMMAVYITMAEGRMNSSDYLRRFLGSLRGMNPRDISDIIDKAIYCMKHGGHDGIFANWAEDDGKFWKELQDIKSKVESLSADAKEADAPIRSSDAIHSRGLRTTVIAQRVQLSYEQSSLTEAEKEFMALTERLSDLLREYFTLGPPQELFLHEVWLCDSTEFLRVFTPRPRAAIEDALAAPQEYLISDSGGKSRSSASPATSMLYQRYLEAGSLINLADLWSSFLENSIEDQVDEKAERESLMQFYGALADLKLLGMIKQSKKKVDHVTKILWKGL